MGSGRDVPAICPSNSVHDAAAPFLGWVPAVRFPTVLGVDFVGVDIFFVLSGYLITWLLVAEVEESGTVDLKRFYARRARRLLPALALVLLVTLGATAMLYAPFEQRMLALGKPESYAVAIA